MTASLMVASAGHGAASVGRDRARDLAINVVLPFLHGAFRNEAGPNGQVYLDLYRVYGKLQENELTREMARVLLDPSWRRLVTTARRQQGLIHLQRALAG